ncbi:protein phosphatase 2C domain-containing protein [Lewinella sp. W8]|uniref:protein phosphatase 2C domain-containing protein n=1 Tax=Lewinella sp. W8 TaxID=2528208 RepID=UPI001565D404
MQLITHSQIGTHHTDHNEDALVAEELTPEHYLLAVMDGCSSGQESHFAAGLITKILRKIARQTNLRTFAERRTPGVQELLKDTVRQLFTTLRDQKALLDIGRYELLTTLVLAVVDVKQRTGEIIVVGDGLVAVNGEITEVDQDNQPDYLGYHLDEPFEEWWPRQQQYFSAEDITDFSLATDGLHTFRLTSPESFPPIGEEEIIRYLLEDREEEVDAFMLRRKLLMLEETHGLKPTDDLTIVRLLLGD